MQAFSFDITHVRGLENGVPDALSRLPHVVDGAWEDEINADYSRAPGTLTMGSIAWSKGVRTSLAAIKAGAPVLELGPRATAPAARQNARGQNARGRGPAVVAPGNPQGRVTVIATDGSLVSPAAGAADPRDAGALRRGARQAGPPGGGGSATDGAPEPATVATEFKHRGAEGNHPIWVPRYSESGRPIAPRDDWLGTWETGDAPMAPPHKDKRGIMERAHALGHAGVDGLVHAVRRSGFDWTGMTADAATVAAGCLACARHRVSREGFSPVVRDSYDECVVGRHWVLDTASMPASATSDFSACLIVTDVASRRVWAEPILGKTATEVGRVLAAIALRDGFPAIISSDNGSEFVNSTVKEMARLMRVDVRLSSEYNPRGNGISERAVRRVTEVLRRRLDGATGQWVEFLQAATYAVNMSPSPTTGSVPLELYLGRAMRGMHDFSGRTDLLVGLDPSDEDTATRLEEARVLLDVVKVGQEIRLERQFRERQAKQARDQMVVRDFVEGDRVFIREAIQPGKLASRLTGPMTVVRKSRGGAYEVREAGGEMYPNKVAPTRLVRFQGSAADGKAFGVKEITDHRLSRVGEEEYLTAWVDPTDGPPAWMPAGAFDDRRCIAEYWSRSTARRRAAFAS